MTESTQNDIGVIFLHHETDEVTKNNLRSFRHWNPGIKIATVSPAAALPGGFSLRDHPERLRIWEEHTSVSWRRARSSDLLVYLWYGVRQVHCETWIIVEWDAFCGMRLDDFVSVVEGFDLVGPSIRLINREPEWAWFKRRATLPVKLQPYAMGIVPFCFIIVSNTALSIICESVPWGQLGDCNGEMRFATLAHACGFPPVAHPLAGWNITWKPLPNDTKMVSGMWHPVKFIAGSKG